jgi:hypothetical protein
MYIAAAFRISSVVTSALSRATVKMLRRVRGVARQRLGKVSTLRVGCGALPFDVDIDARFRKDSLDRLASAILLIDATWPRHAARLAQDASALRVVRGGYAGYRPLTREILVGDDLVSQNDAAVLASYLVHEATHARLSRHVLRLDNRSRVREERRCYLAQSAFLRTLASGGWRNADLWAVATEQRFAQRFGRSVASRVP